MVILAYTRPLLKKEVLQKIGLQGEKASTLELIKSRVQILGTTSIEHSFLQLLYNLEIKQVDSRIMVSQ